MLTKQTSFLGGLDRLYDTTRRSAENSYPYLVNARIRDDSVCPVSKPLELLLPEEGNLQGLYSTNTLAVVFINGRAYYRDFTLAGSSFNKIDGFQMDENAAVFYAELVPSSSINYERKAGTDKVISFNDTIAASDACLVVQDGVSQPHAIFSNGLARIIQTWDEWSTEIREYVPIGKQMFYDTKTGILHVVLPNGKRIARSVSGRPLDFLIAIDENGNKLGTINESGAQVLAYAVSEEEITAIKPSNSPEGFLVGSKNNIWLVSGSTSELIYGEPLRFSATAVMNTGPINHFVNTNSLGDTLFIDVTSIRSFNAVLQAQNEGRNAIFSRKISKIIEGINQTSDSCACEFDNYNLFSVQTKFGPALMVYDNVNEHFVGLDMYSTLDSGERIKFLSPLKINNEQRLLAATSGNRLLELFAGTEKETASVYIGDFTTESFEHKIAYFRGLFLYPFEDGTVNATTYVDGKPDQSLSFPVKDSLEVDSDIVPNILNDKDDTRSITFTLETSRQGHKSGVLWSWDFNIRLSKFEIELKPFESKVDTTQKVQDFVRNRLNTGVSISEYAPDTGNYNTVITILGKGFTNVTFITIGGVNHSFTTINDGIITVAAKNSGVIKLVSNYDTVTAGVFTLS